MDAKAIEALRELLDIEQEHKDRPKYEIVKLFFSRDLGQGVRNDLLAIRWQEIPGLGLECRKMFYSKKKDKWTLGRLTKIGIEELDYINKNYSEIRAILNNDIT